MNKQTDYKATQYLLTGAALGLYFGWAYRPSGETFFSTVIFLSVLVTIVMSLLRWRREGQVGLVGYAGSVFVRTAVALGILATRHYIYEAGGKIAVVVAMMIAGGLFGIYLSRMQSE